MKRNLFYILSIMSLLTFLSGCSDDESSSDDNQSDSDREALLLHIGNDLIIPAYENLSTHTASLSTEINTFTATPTTANLLSLQTAFQDAYLAWQQCSMYEFGPASQQTLRASLNTYPANTSTIEDNIAAGTYNLDAFDNTDAIGFPAIDYLIYDSSDDNVIAHFTEDENADNRKQYLIDIMAHIFTKVTETSNNWSADSGNYITTFSQASGTDVGSSLSQLTNSMIQHYERYTRDGKIGIPVGRRSSGIARPTNTEAYYGGFSVALAVKNVQALQSLYLGTSFSGTAGEGLEEYLIEEGESELDQEIQTKFTAVINDLETLADPLSTTIDNDQETVDEVYNTMQELLVVLKTDMTAAMSITISYQDTDGD